MLWSEDNKLYDVITVTSVIVEREQVNGIYEIIWTLVDMNDADSPFLYFHREAGPAIQSAGGKFSYWYNDRPYEEEEFHDLVRIR